MTGAAVNTARADLAAAFAAGITRFQTADDKGSPETKRRTKIVLRSILGQILDKEACCELGVEQAGLERLRRDAMQGIWKAIRSEADDCTAN
jgi:hypothetical protein